MEHARGPTDAPPADQNAACSFHRAGESALEITHLVRLAVSAVPILVALLAPVTATTAQSLLADVNQSASSSLPSIVSGAAVADGARVFFAAARPAFGEELWLTDGTAAGTSMVLDLVAGSGGSAPRQLTAFAGGAAFTVGPLRALWHSDGTAAGTRLLTAASLGLEDPVVAGARLYFAANAGGAGQELWSSDGTPGGTAIVKDIRAGSGWSEPRLMVGWLNQVWFVAYDGIATRLWKSDGTAAGTVEVAPGVSYGLLRALVATSNALWFTSVGGTGGELWRCDGTAIGTTLVRGGFASVPYPASLTAFGPLVLFVADDGVIGPEPWRSDGTGGGTFALGDLYPGSAPPPGGAPRSLTPSGNLVWFAADDGVHGHELWATDGTQSGTRLVADVRTGADSSVPSQLRAAGMRLFFTADDGMRGAEPWSSDGTPAGTQLLRDVNPFDASNPSRVVSFGGGLFFTADDGVHGTEPWISDGTTAGTALLIDIGVGVGASDPDRFTRFGRSFVFAADDGVRGQEPWISDGTPAGTTLLRDIAPGLAHSYPLGMREWRGRLWFRAYDASLDVEPWVSDGTAAGTVRFADLVPGAAGSYPDSFTPLDGWMVFAAGGLQADRELWTTDGTPAGTFPIDIDPNSAAAPRDLVRAGELAYFVATDTAHGTELRITDGTPLGTRLVADLVPGGGRAHLSQLAAVGERLFFQGSATFQTFPVDVELWTSDGTAAGTVQLSDIAPGPGSSRPRSLVAWRDRVWFFAEAGSLLGSELWTSDGTVAGTVRVAGPVNATTGLVAAGDLLFFAAGAQLWRSDGTIAGTFAVPIGNPAVTAVTELAAAGHGTRVVFAAVSAGRGREPWISDGTAAGTMPLGELWPGPDGSSPAHFATVGPLVAFAAHDGMHGVEPFILPLAAVGGALAQPFGAPCPGGAGEPRIGAIAAPRVGVPGFALTLRSARPSAPAFCVLGTDVLPGAELVPCAPAITGASIAVALGTDPMGAATLPIPVPPNAALIGARLFAQFVVVDPQGRFFGVLAFSDLIDLVVGAW